MFRGMRRIVPIFAVAVLLAVLAASLGVAASPRAAEEPALAVEMKALASEFQVTYSITLVNGTTSSIGDIFVAGAIPSGAAFVEAVDTPEGTRFLGVQGGAAAWVSGRVPANSKQGPFSYKVMVAAKEAGPAHAWVRWTQPREGSATSVTVPFAAVVIDLPKRGCTACHALVDPATGFATLAYEAKVRGGPDHPPLPFDTPVTTCLSCHAPGKGEGAGMGVVAPKMLRDIVHPAHLNSPTFTTRYKGNCFTCHNVTGDGQFVLLGEKLKTDFRGIPSEVPVSGIPPSQAR